MEVFRFHWVYNATVYRWGIKNQTPWLAGLHQARDDNWTASGQYIEVFSSTIYSPRIESVTLVSSHKFGSTGYIWTTEDQVIIGSTKKNVLTSDSITFTQNVSAGSRCVITGAYVWTRIWFMILHQVLCGVNFDGLLLGLPVVHVSLM